MLTYFNIGQLTYWITGENLFGNYFDPGNLKSQHKIIYGLQRSSIGQYYLDTLWVKYANLSILELYFHQNYVIYIYIKLQTYTL